MYIFDLSTWGAEVGDLYDFKTSLIYTVRPCLKGGGGDGKWLNSGI